MKLRLPRRRIWRAAIYLGSLLLVLIAADMVLVQVRRTIHPGFDTTRIVAPLQPDGSIDYLIAVDQYFGRGVTRDNNAAALIAQAIGRKGLASYQVDGITDWLGIGRLPEAGAYFIPYTEFSTKHGSTPTEWTDLTRPRAWPLHFDQITTDWVKENEKPLALFTEASKLPRYFIPFYAGFRKETMAEIQLPHIAFIRDACRALQTRGLMRLAAGDVAGFREDLLTVHRLARLVGQGQTLVERVVAITIESSACEQERVGISSGKLSATEEKAMALELAALGDLPPIADAFDRGERFFALDILQTFARIGPVRAGELLNAIASAPSWHFGPPAVFYLVPMPFDELMRTVNHYDDGVLAAMGAPFYPDRIAAIKLLDQQEAVTAKPDEQISMPERLSLFDLFGSKWPAKLLLPTLLTLTQRKETARMESRLTQVALMLDAFKADHGTYPASLAELTTELASAITIDLFSDKPLSYTHTARGYRLYSVGPNMNDEGGSTTKPADDLLVERP